MKKLIFLLFCGTLVCAKPSYPIHPGVGAIYKGPNAETIIQGPDGSIITSEHAGGAVAVDGHNALAEAAVASAAASAAAHSVIDQTAVAAAAASASSASHSISLSQAPIVVEEPIVVAQPVVVAHEPVLVAKAVDTAALDGPSGSILTHGENAVISGPSSTTIREGNVIASIDKPELNTIIVKAAPPHTAVAVAQNPVIAPGVVNIAEANAHLADINLINEANAAAAQLSEANRAAVVHGLTSQGLAAEVNAANAAAIAEANRAALAHSQEEAVARANLEAQANLDAQLAHAVVSPQIRFANVNAANSAALAQAGHANLDAHLVSSVAPQVAIAEINAINSANFAHAQETAARANLEAQLAAERNAIVTNNVVSLRPGLSPIITQGNHIISDGVISSTAAPVVAVTPTVSTIGPIVSTTAKPIVLPATANVVSSTIAPTAEYIVKTSPVQNVLVSSTLRPIAAVPVASHPAAVVAPVSAVDAGQIVYQSSSSSSSQAESHSSSSQQSSVNIVNGGGLGAVGGIVGGHLVPIPGSVATSDYSQWQESVARSGHSAGESIYATNVHGGLIH